MFTHLSSRGKFTEAEVRIYAAEILLAIQHLHDVCLNFVKLFISDILGYLRVIKNRKLTVSP